MGGLDTDAAFAELQLSPQAGLQQAAPDAEVAISQQLEVGPLDRQLAQGEGQAWRADAWPQSKAATAVEAASSNARLQLLKLETLEIKEGRGLQVTHRLPRHHSRAISDAKKSIGDRLQPGAAHQQLQVDAALLPLQLTTAEGREEDQAITTAGDAQLQVVIVSIERQRAP